MSLLFEELDHQSTPMGDISLRRRRILSLDTDVYEVVLGDEFLMSSLFTVGETALATLGLAAASGEQLDVVVGGLGLGYTARAALNDPRVRSLVVVEALAPVIDWHQRELTPLGAGLSRDPRCSFAEGDFFALAEGASGFDPDQPGRVHDAILLDIDHSPGALLNPSHAGFYTSPGLNRLARWLRPGGVFAMWSDAAPEKPFLVAMRENFWAVEAKIVEFDNPLQNRPASCTIYLGVKRDSEGLSAPGRGHGPVGPAPAGADAGSPFHRAEFEGM